MDLLDELDCIKSMIGNATQNLKQISKLFLMYINKFQTIITLMQTIYNQVIYNV
jgi:hypothetical protein